MTRLLLIAAALAGLATASLAADPPAVPDPGAQEVWITRTGERYHRGSCRYAKIRSTLREAQAKGLTPCKVCNP
jgi:micrococcal nuclease